MTTALIIGDVQTGIVEAFPWTGSVLRPLATLLPLAREQGTPVRAALRPGRAEVPPRNPNATWMLDSGELFQESSPATSIHPDSQPMSGEAVLTAVAQAGVATSGVVLATLIEATERDYAVTVLRDGCADPEADIHDFLLQRLSLDAVRR